MEKHQFNNVDYVYFLLYIHISQNVSTWQPIYQTNTILIHFNND